MEPRGNGARFGAGAGSVLPSPQAVVARAINAVANRTGRPHGGGIWLVSGATGSCCDRFALLQRDDELLELVDVELLLELDTEPPDAWPPPQPPLELDELLLELDDEPPDALPPPRPPLLDELLELDDELLELALDDELLALDDELLELDDELLELDELLDPGDEVTMNLCEVERPPRSVANTVTLAVPAARAAMVTTLPDEVTLTRLLSDETASKSSSSPSGSRKYRATSSSATLFTSISMSLILPTRSGARLEFVLELEDELLLELDEEELLELDDEPLELDDELLPELDEDELDDEELDDEELDDELLLADHQLDPSSSGPTRPTPAYVQAASCVIPALTTPPASSRRNARRSSR